MRKKRHTTEQLILLFLLFFAINMACGALFTSKWLRIGVGVPLVLLVVWIVERRGGNRS